MIPADLDDIRMIIREELDGFALRHPMACQLLYTKSQAAILLGISVASLEILINRGEIKMRRFGSRKLIPHGELQRVANKDIPKLWPERIVDSETGEEKTTRRLRRVG